MIVCELIKTLFHLKMRLRSFGFVLWHLHNDGFCPPASLCPIARNRAAAATADGLEPFLA